MFNSGVAVNLTCLRETRVAYDGGMHNVYNAVLLDTTRHIFPQGYKLTHKQNNKSRIML